MSGTFSPISQLSLYKRFSKDFLSIKLCIENVQGNLLITKYTTGLFEKKLCVRNQIELARKHIFTLFLSKILVCLINENLNQETEEIHYSHELTP